MAKDMGQKVPCKVCGKIVRLGNMAKHQRSRKCKDHLNDKTAGQPIQPPLYPSGAGIGLSASPAEPSQSHLKEIDLNKEFKTMATKFEKKSSQEDKEKKYKYKCGECGEYFNLPAQGEDGELCCPFCGK